MEIYNEIEKIAESTSMFLASEQVQPFLVGAWWLTLGIVLTLIIQGKGNNPNGVGAC